MKRLPYLLGATGLAVALSTVSCTTLGGHVKGGFACRAPIGTCAPMSSIDAQAIAGLGASSGPAMPFSSDGQEGQPRFIASSGQGVLVRTGEQVMRVVFPAHTDGNGIYHDEAVAHVVSERSGWTLQPADAPPAGSLDAAIVARSPTTAPTSAAVPTVSAALTSATPLNLREAAAGLSAPPDPLPDAPHDQVAVDMPGSPGDVPSADAIAAARAGHRIGDPMPVRSGKHAHPGQVALHARHHMGSGRTPPTVRGAATAALNRAALHRLSGANHDDNVAAVASSSLPATAIASAAPETRP